MTDIDYRKKGVNWESLARAGVLERVPAAELALAFGVRPQSVHSARKKWRKWGVETAPANGHAKRKRRKRRSDAGVSRKNRLLKEALIAYMARARTPDTIRKALVEYQKLEMGDVQ